MTKKVTGNDLKKLLEGVLSEKMTREDFSKYITAQIGAIDVAKQGQDTGLDTVTIDTLYDPDGLAATIDPADDLQLSDVQYYVDNPKKINTKIQSHLIALTKWSQAEIYGDATDARATKTTAETVLQNAEQTITTSWPDLKAAIDDKEKAEPNLKNTNANGSTTLPWWRGSKGVSKALRSLRSPWLEAVKAKAKAESVIARANVKIEKEDFYKSNKKYFDDISKLSQEALNNLEREIAAAAEREQSVSSPVIKTAQGDVGIFPKDQEDLVERLLSSFTTIEARMAEINRISRDFYVAVTDAAKLKTKQPSQLLSEIMLIDIFNSMLKEFDSGSGAYLFEHFLALVTGGIVLGKSKTKAGKMGSADFKMVTDAGTSQEKVELGSAKFYQNASQAKQAVSGYQDLWERNAPDTGATPGEHEVSVTYVIAGKKQDVTQEGDPTKGSSDPARLIGAEIYTPVVTYNGSVFKINGVPVKPKGGEISFSKNLGDSLGMLYVTTTRTSTFKEMLEAGIEKQSQNVKDLFESFKSYFKELDKASSEAKSYIAKGDVTQGERTYQSLRKAETNFDSIVSGLEYSANPQALKSVQTEQKITADFLKKLISESLNK
jgi:hypothetical protein